VVIAEYALLGLIAVCAIYLLTSAIRSIGERFSMARWPRVDGRVLEHAVHHRRRHHRPQFVVEYSVAGRTLKTTCDSPTRSGYTHGGPAYDELAKYPIGSTVQVFVDPDNPTRAFLWLPEVTMIIAQLIGGVLFLGVAAAGINEALK
jgi:hypothetical protein